MSSILVLVGVSGKYFYYCYMIITTVTMLLYILKASQSFLNFKLTANSPEAFFFVEISRLYWSGQMLTQH